MPELKLDDAFFPALWTLALAVGTRPEILLAVWLAESGLDPRARNSDGCIGLNQSCPLPYGPGFPGDPDAYQASPASAQHVDQWRSASAAAADAYQASPASAQLAWIAPQVVRGYHLNGGRPFLSAARYYQANFLPATLATAKNDDDVVAAPGGPYPSAYDANTILDGGARGAITLRDLGDFVGRAIARSPDLFREAVDRTYAAAPPGAPWATPDLQLYELASASTVRPAGRPGSGGVLLLAIVGLGTAWAVGAHR